MAGLDRDPRVARLEEQLETAEGADRARYRAELATLRETVHAEKLGEVAEEFDRVHDIRRAQRVGSVDAIIPARELRPYLIEAVERGLSRGTDGGGPG